MPIIEELDDDDGPASTHEPSPEERASSAVAQALALLADASRPLEARYEQALQLLPPPTTFLRSAPQNTPSFQPQLLELLQVPAAFAPPDQHDADGAAPTPRRSAAFERFASELLGLLRDLPLEPTPSLAATLAAYADASEAWASPRTSVLAAETLAAHPADEETLRRVLAEHIKPLFTARDIRITPAGRAALAAQHTRQAGAPLDLSTPAWQQHPSTIPVLAWTLAALPPASLEAAWGLLVPPLLTLLDATSIPAKTRGCALLSALLQKLAAAHPPSTLLARTGMGAVFWDALLPATMFLPPLTPTVHALPLLAAAYPALFALARLREPTAPSRRAKLLDAVVREGVVSGFRFAGENVQVAEALCGVLRQVADEMGVYAVRHLGVLLPLLGDVLTNPFASVGLPLLERAVEAEVALMRVAWPRVSAYRAEVLRGVCICWRRLSEERVGEGVQRRLEDAVRVLAAVVRRVEGDGVWEGVVRGVVEADEGFAGLMGVREGQNEVGAAP